jgi:hypothetical protein
MSYMSELDIKSRNAENDLTEMARQVASKVAMVQIVELTALAMEGPNLSERAARQMTDRVTEIGAKIIIALVEDETRGLREENERLRATIDMLCDQVTDKQMAAEFVPMTIPEAIPVGKTATVKALQEIQALTNPGNAPYHFAETVNDVYRVACEALGVEP